MGSRGVMCGPCCAGGGGEHAGLPGLLRDLQRLSEDQDSSDIVFLLGPHEERVYAHKIILSARCKSFQNTKRGEICRIPGSSVSPAGSGPTPVRIQHALPDTFRQFILYVYTGKLLLQDSGVFEMMTLAADLGVEELRSACEDHVTSTLSVASACTFLAAAMDIQERPSGCKSAASLMEKCISYIGENASECIKTNAFLNLPKDALIKLISSDYLCLEEEDVWRCALSWAKHQAGVTQPTAHWAEEERARVCQHLTPLMQHVRLLLIDSQVFAEEVEPTGAVAMEVSLERYRRAALRGNHHPDFDKRLQPRLSLNLFPGSVILQQDRSHLQNILNNWYGSPKQTWRLVFRASSHAFSAAAFHAHCDGVAPSMILVNGSRGEICGGFSDVAWHKTSHIGGYISSEKAFLFSLHGGTDAPAKYNIVKKPYAICYHADCGPIFGAGADLLISHNCNSNIDSYSNLPHSYDGESASSASLMGDYNFTVINYEVYTIDTPGHNVNKIKHERYP
ncbi:uncharacterized protein LOC143912224 isoform X2 [Arctopsyche grandis]|uniref:uncharacterized protein LOC143912224 isoform X2 n=1 Tax=Arctopsyche grandis TaxID=121162 RepID=UPI00406D86AE